VRWQLDHDRVGELAAPAVADRAGHDDGPHHRVLDHDDHHQHDHHDDVDQELRRRQRRHRVLAGGASLSENPVSDRVR
jgi:hypothetical protein